jgi:hypothetical protein
MEKDKILVREIINDFINYCDKKNLFPLHDYDDTFSEWWEKSFIKSSGEALTLAPIEQQEKVCSKCGAPIKVYSQEFCSNDECDYSHP